MLDFSSVSANRARIDVLAVPVCEDSDLHEDPTIKMLVAKAIGLEEFSGEKNQQIVLYDPSDTKIRRCVFIGIGSREKLNAEALRVFGSKAVKAAMGAKCGSVVIAVPVGIPQLPDHTTVIKAIAEGAFLSNHAFEKYKTDSKFKALKKIDLLVPAHMSTKKSTLLSEVETVCRGTLQAREWVCTPSNDKPPVRFAKEVKEALSKSGVTVTIKDQAGLKREKFGALLAVAAGSANPPCLVELVYAPKTAKKTIVLVGKGVTFDTGGINLKPAAGLDTMKADMSGAAAVAGTMTAVAKLKPKHKIIGILPLVENMPSGTATRPGDIITSYAGKTIEIGNTDAEGRLILADAMAYAVKKYKPDVLIDMATLTGACMVALGEKIAGVFSHDDDLAQAVLDAGRDTHERCWRLPLPEDYKDQLKSEIADMNNLAATRYGGSITAALFLSAFVKDTRWAHIDIAGPAHFKKGNDYCGPGGTGFGVRLLVDLIGRL